MKNEISEGKLKKIINCCDPELASKGSSDDH
jgi:hypothetical protein